ncbi:catechol 2,3-dioxygenase [Rhizobium sp. SG_E_25_P2]|uniref:VOC family protein n=1 Tax=Rhizobium sp. SG_E_25_P2 TaxID=2879942 RepID=UPI00247312F1|nr:VOC family protein [Rhizobium sp. SG_E_25_P2]MDH6264927.1 catechol 2,3-dioxygenase [Rhizobium sp. SG_E_25_P2]
MNANSIGRRAVLHFIATGAIALSGSPFVARAAEQTPRANPSSSFAVTTPIHVRSVTLRVRDLNRMTGFYREVIGLDLLARDVAKSELGKDGALLLTLLAKPDDQPDDKVSAGLYHTAFLMPDRRTLGAWLIHAYLNGAPFTGFADHLVSEALYLDDPEGNGIEVYADRSPMQWTWDKGGVVMATEQLDMDGLVAGLPRTPTPNYSAPSGLRIGHIHMRVGDVAAARDFYVGAAGLDLTRLLPDSSAAFFANGRYHHHVGSNIWQSRGAGKRPEAMSGLDEAVFACAPELMDGLRERLNSRGLDHREEGDTVETLDPWGSRIRFVVA